MQNDKGPRPAALIWPESGPEGVATSDMAAGAPAVKAVPGAQQAKPTPTLRVAPPIFDTRVIDYSGNERLVWD